MIEIRQAEKYAQWFNGLRDRQAKARIAIRIRRLSLGNPGDVRPVGQGVSELRIDYGPGYRVYFTRRGELVVILPVLCHVYNLGLVGRKRARCKERAAKTGSVDPLSRYDAADGPFPANPAGRGPEGRGLCRLSSKYSSIRFPPRFAPTAFWPSANPNV
jgi:putative addiction module killer protein